MNENKKLSYFLKGRAKKVEDRVKVIVSDRFLDEDGKIVPFEIRLLSGREITKLQNSAVKSNKDMTNVEFDSGEFVSSLVIACVEYPDLMDAELQDSYGVNNPRDLLDKMLTGAEYVNLQKEIQKANGMLKDFKVLVNEAKN